MSPVYTTDDPELTQNGYLDASNVHSVWVQEQSDANIGLPQISYCSPLTRCLATNTITFGTEVYGDSSPKLNTIVVEVSALVLPLELDAFCDRQELS